MVKFRIIYLTACIAIMVYVLWKHFYKPKKKSKSEYKPALQGDAKKEKEDLKYTLDIVNSWINNCDQKAGILLTVVGVALTVIVTSDFIKSLRSYIFKPFFEYCNDRNSNLVFSSDRFTVLFLLAIATASLIISCYYLFRTICANLDYEKMRKENPGMVNKSHIFFGSISGMKYDEFKKEEVSFENDLRSQIYVNSKIATTKFQNYNEGLYWFKLLVLVSAMLFFAVMFMN